MAGYKPGPLCPTTAEPIDEGTHCLCRSPTPGPLGVDTRLHKPLDMSVTVWGNGALNRINYSARGVGTLSASDFEDAAKSLGSDIDVFLLHAFAMVESGGKSGFGFARLPIIAYEGHIFRKYTHKKYDKDYPLLSYRYVKKAGARVEKKQ